MPFNEAPRPPRTWWGTIPGQLSILAIAIGVLVILFQALGIVDFRG